MSETKEATKQEKAKARRKLEREAVGLARHFGHPIGVEVIYLAAESFQATPESFDEEGHLTGEAEDEFLQVLHENWERVCENVGHHVCQITRSDLNTLREQQGLPPV